MCSSASLSTLTVPLSTQVHVYICYSPAGRSVLGKTVPEVSSRALGLRLPKALLETEGTVFPKEIGKYCPLPEPKIAGFSGYRPLTIKEINKTGY